MDNVRISPSRKWKETENNKTSIEHEFHLDSKSIYYVVICIIIWYINTRNKNETKKRLAIKSTMRYTIHLEAKSNQSLGGDDYKKEVLPYDKTAAWNLIGYIHRK